MVDRKVAQEEVPQLTLASMADARHPFAAALQNLQMAKHYKFVEVKQKVHMLIHLEDKMSRGHSPVVLTNFFQLELQLFL